MAEATRLKDIQADLKRVLERLEQRDAEYDVNRALDLERIQRLEASVSTLQSLLNHSGQQPRFQQPQPFQVRNVKLDFPRFDGTDVLQWIFKAEQFFNYYATPDDQRLTISSIHLDKGVVPWYQMLVRNQPFHSWIAFTRALEAEFGPSPFECPRSTLFKLTQTQTVSEFYTKFTALANRTHGVSSDALLDCFISGLKPEIRHDVLAQSPISLTKAVSLAKLFEEKYQPRPKSISTYPQNRPTTSSYPARTTNTAPILPTPNTRPTPQPTRNPNIKHISAAEMQLRRERGQCFTCDDKFSFNHKCLNRQYLLLTGNPDSPTEETTEPPDLSNLTLEPEIDLPDSTVPNPGHTSPSMRYAANQGWVLCDSRVPLRNLLSIFCLIVAARTTFSNQGLQIFSSYLFKHPQIFEFWLEMVTLSLLKGLLSSFPCKVKQLHSLCICCRSLVLTWS
jgi:hypothetical protein